MRRLDPREILADLKKVLPRRCHKHIAVVGSLAVACHFRQDLEGRAVYTKDADFVLQPAGEVEACREIAETLLDHGWTPRLLHGEPRPVPEPGEDLPFVRLYPPETEEFFIEFLGLPEKEQREVMSVIPLKLRGGWYGVPCYRFMGLAALDQQVSESGLRYAAPWMTALANLLSHGEVGSQRMSAPIAGTRILRSAKDLGRVLAIAWLSGREEMEKWVEPWAAGLEECFPESWRELASGIDAGLNDLLARREAFEEAHATTQVGLLSGKNVAEENLRAVADQLLADVIVPFKEAAA